MRFVFVHGGFRARVVLGTDDRRASTTLPWRCRRRPARPRCARRRGTARWAFERLDPERFGDTTVTPVLVPNFCAADLRV